MKYASVSCALLLAVAFVVGGASSNEACDPIHCRDDAYCPQYFKGICGAYKGDYMLFSGDCYMFNHNCRTCSEYVKVDDKLCQKSNP